LESREITLLTEAYLHGLINFQYTHPLSNLREQLVLAHVEKKSLYKYLSTSLQAEASMLSGMPASKGTLDFIKDKIGSLEKLELPYKHKEDKIKVRDKVQTEEQVWTEILKARVQDK